MNQLVEKTIIRLSVLFIFATFLFSGCKKEDSERIVVMTVSPELVQDGLRPPGSPDGSVLLMECKIENSDEILRLSKGTIEGFDYVEGFTYRIKVKIIKLNNPPADGYANRYVLIEVLSKE
ncbi:MAG: DUF4377 domain-containing protein [Bacteroidales bacterium]|nr:DUF4377 domain-containing protein [Bacteroidales bacterium]MDT3357106.1 DUF4377 domain-containing protein [Bacteroidota bacterium]